VNAMDCLSGKGEARTGLDKIEGTLVF